MTRKISVKADKFKLQNPFKIAHGTRYYSETVYVRIEEAGYFGEGEGYPYERYEEDTNLVIKQINSKITEVSQIKDLREIGELLPAGAARNAVVNAFWDLESKKQNKPIWQLAGLKEPKEVITAYTLVIDTPDKMAISAAEVACKYPLLKLKLAGDGCDLERVRKVREVARDNDLIIDANESLSADLFQKYISEFVDLRVKMIEQPFPQGEDDILKSLDSPIIICADESCHVAADLESLLGKYQMVNIKLDKTGGFTEALNLYNKARDLGFQIMVGCMISSSLGVEPAFHLTSVADLVDIDAPLLLAEDRKSNLCYDGARVYLKNTAV